MLVTAAGPQGVHIRLDASLYGEQVVYKCFYWYGRDFDVVIERTDRERSFAVEVGVRGQLLTDAAIEQLVSRIKRDLIDFKTRDIVSQETQTIRELLVAKAFAHFDETDQIPIGTIADLEGIEPWEPRDASA